MSLLCPSFYPLWPYRLMKHACTFCFEALSSGLGTFLSSCLQVALAVFVSQTNWLVCKRRDTICRSRYVCQNQFQDILFKWDIPFFYPRPSYGRHNLVCSKLTHWIWNLEFWRGVGKHFGWWESIRISIFVKKGYWNQCSSINCQDNMGLLWVSQLCIELSDSELVLKDVVSESELAHQRIVPSIGRCQ